MSERSRNEVFAERAATRITREIASEANPYLAERVEIHGYDLLGLARGTSVPEVVYLLFRGELPDDAAAELLTTWWISAIAPGPRHPATRAAMNAAVAKTNAVQFVPVATAVLGGAHLGAEEVRRAHRFVTAHRTEIPAAAAARAVGAGGRPERGDWHVVPGFGTRFGGVDPLARRIAALLAALPGAGAALAWSASFAAALERYGLGWLDTGIAAAVLVDLGFDEYAAAGLFQLVRAPGALAHAIELVGAPPTALPFPDEAHYVVEP
jgi:citrate synthase